MAKPSPPRRRKGIVEAGGRASPIYRRDATLGEDRTRHRHSRTLMNRALLRRANLRLLALDASDAWLPARKEELAAKPTAAFALIITKL